MHLTDHDLDTYIARTPDRRRRRELDLHLGACPQCALRLEAAAAQPEPWERREMPSAA